MAILKALVNLGNFEHIEFFSNEFDTMSACAEFLIKEMSKIEHYEIESYIINYLLPIIYDLPKEISYLKDKKLALNTLEGINAQIKHLENEYYHDKIKYSQLKDDIFDLDKKKKNLEKEIDDLTHKQLKLTEFKKEGN